MRGGFEGIKGLRNDSFVVYDYLLNVSVAAIRSQLTSCRMEPEGLEGATDRLADLLAVLGIDQF